MNSLSFAALIALLFTGSDVRPTGIVLPPQTHRVGAFGAGCDFATLQAAIEASGDRDTILVSTDAVHPVQATISHSLSIRGGFTSCTAASPGPTPTQVTGTGSGRPLTLFNVGASRLRIRLAGLAISSGDSDFGGGVYADGGIDLTLADLSLEGNEADDSGGGLALFDGVDLQVEGQVAIQQNHAPLGGGFHCESSDITVVGRLSVRENQGPTVGGLSLVDCSLDSIPGSTLDVDTNTATVVGAVFVTGDSAVLLQGTTRVRSNQTSLGPAVLIEHSASLVATGPLTLFQSNASTSAAASVLRVVGTAVVQLGSNDADCSLALAGSGIRRACVGLLGNATTSGSGAIHVSGGGRLELHRAWALGNRSLTGDGHVARVTSDAALGVYSSVFMEHDDDGPLFVVADGSLEIAAATFANNQSPASLIEADDGSSTTLHAVVAHANGGDLLSLAGGSSGAGTCLFLEAGASASGIAITGLVDDGGFRQPDFSFRDLRPSNDSSFVDRCTDAVPLPVRDLNGDARPVDFPLLANLPGTYDAGAFELNDFIFGHGFEATAAAPP